MTVRPIPPWFIKRRGRGWLVTARGWVALAVFAALLLACVGLMRGIDRVLMGSLLVMGFLALVVGKVDLQRLGLE